MNYFKHLTIFVVITSYCLAGQPTGEKDFSHYHGPLDPRLKVDRQNDDVTFLENFLDENYINSLIMLEPFKLESDYNSLIAPNFSCTQRDLDAKKEYIDYLVRLTSISSLYEYLRSVSIALYQLGEESSCPLEYEGIFKSCRSKKSDMKKFVARMNDYFPDIIDWGKYPVKLSTDKKFNISKYHNDLTAIGNNYFKDLSKKNLIKSCQYITKEITSLCNEEDQYLTGSGLKGAREYIVNTSAFKIVNTDGKGEACYDRYIKEHTKTEKISIKSKAIIENSLKKDLRIFWYGSLKEFDQRDISLITIKQQAPKKVVAKAIKPKSSRINLDNIRIVRKSTPAPVVKKKRSITVIKVSEFEKTVARYQKRRKRTDLDMTSFKNDYEFSKKVLKKFNTSLRDYQTRKKLSTMKRIDRLGSSKAPMSLTFLKYLIEYNLHQGLYNMTGVLGNEFYVFNDLEGKRRPVKIFLDNSESTKFKWKIWVTGL